jgi:hypothetical protein
MGMCASVEDDGVDVAGEDGLAIGVCRVEG